MRIGYLCYAGIFQASGPGSRTHALLTAFTQQGHEVHVRTETPRDDLHAVQYSLDPTGLAKMAQQVDVCIVRLDGSCHAERLTEQMLNARPDLPLVLEIHAPLEEQLHYVSVSEQERLSRQDWIERGNAVRRRLVDSGAVAYGVSEGMVQYAREQLGARRTLLCPNAADPDRFAPRWPRPAPFTVLWTGSPRYKWQAVDLVVATAGQMPQTRFVLACSDAEGVPDLPTNVVTVYKATTNEMVQLYDQSHASLVLYHDVPDSRWGFYHSPLKLFEAMAAGVPVIGSDLGQIPEVIKLASCGLVVPNDPAAVAQSLRHLQDDPASGEQLGSAARTRAEQRTWQHAAAEIVRFCQPVGRL